MSYSVMFYEQLYPMDPSPLAERPHHLLFKLEASTRFALNPGDVFDASSWKCDDKPCKFRVVRVEQQNVGTSAERTLVFVNLMRGTAPLRSITQQFAAAGK